MAVEAELIEVGFDLPATRPVLLFGVPYNLAVTIGAIGAMFWVVWDTGAVLSDLTADAMIIGVLAAVWSTAAIVLQSDPHGWGCFLAWLRLDARCLDTRDWGGAHVSALPLRSLYRTGMTAR